MKNFFQRMLLIFALLTFTLPLQAQDWAGMPRLEFSYRGNWSATADYNSNDAVRGSNARLYVAVEDNVPRNTNPVGSTRYWAEAISNQGLPGPIGTTGDSLDAIYIDSSTIPTLPTAPSYSNGTFSNISPWSNTVPSPPATVWIGIYTVAADNSLSNPGLVKLTGDVGSTGSRGATGTDGTSIGVIFIRAASTPSLPTDNTGVRTGARITTAPPGWHLTQELADNGSNDLYMSLAWLPGGNTDIDYFTIVNLTAEDGERGLTGAIGPRGPPSNTSVFVFQRATSPPSLPANNTGTRSGAELSAAPSGWSLGDPTGTDPLYMAYGILPGDSTTNINWRSLSKLGGEVGATGGDGARGDDGDNGFTTQLIYRKVNQYDYVNTPSVTYNGSTLGLPSDQWSLTPYNSRKFAEWPLGVSTPNDLAIDPDTNIVYLLGTTEVYRKSLTGADQTPPNLNLRASNNEPRGITVIGDNIWVLNSDKRSPDNNYLYEIYVYAKDGSGYVRTITIDTGRDDTDPVGIAHADGKVYVVSNRGPQDTKKALRVFNTAGVEQTSEGLEHLIGDITDVIGIDADDSYIYILDGTDSRVYIFDRTDPLRRRTSLEFTLDSTHTNPVGLALSTFEAHIIDGTNNFRYYNPRNILWASTIHYRQDQSGPVTSSSTFWITPERSEGDGGTTIVQQTITTGGTGGGRDVQIQYSVDGITYQSSVPNPVYIRFSTDGGTTWGAGYKFRGDGTQGPPGNSFDLVYRWSVSTLSVPPTGGTAVDGRLRSAPDLWSISIPAEIAGANLYASVGEIDGNDNTIAWSEPFNFGGSGGGTDGIDARTTLTTFDIIPDTSTRDLYSSRNATTQQWEPYGTGAEQPGWSNVRGNFGDSSNTNVARIQFTPVYDDHSARSTSPITSGFRGVPRTFGYRPLKITPSTDARAISGQTAQITVVGTIDRTSFSTDSSFGGRTPTPGVSTTYTFPVVNNVLQPIYTNIEYSNISSISTRNFFDGTLDIEFVEGISLSSDGVYAFELQINSQLQPQSGNRRPRTGFNVGELRIKLTVEEVDGTLVKSFDAQPHDFDRFYPAMGQGGERNAIPVIPSRAQFTDYITTVPQSFSEGDLIYFSYWFLGNEAVGTSPDNNPRMRLRLTDNDQVDSQFTIYKYNQGSGSGTGAGEQGPPGESNRSIWVRSVGVPNTPNANDLGIDAAGRFTSLSSNGVNWLAFPPNVGTGINYKQYLGIQGTTIRLIGGPVPDRGEQGLMGDSQRELYQRSATPITLPPSLTGVTYTNGTFSSLPGNWTEQPLSGTDPLYVQQVEIRSNGTLVLIGNPYRETGERGKIGPKGAQGEPGRDGVPGVSSTIEMTKFTIRGDTQDRSLHSSRENPTDETWDNWGRGNSRLDQVSPGNLGRPGIIDVRGNFIGSGNPNIATQSFTSIVNDLDITTGTAYTGPFSSVPRNPLTYRPILITPSSDATITAGQTATVTIIGTRNASIPRPDPSQFDQPFEFTVVDTFEISNGTVNPIITIDDYSTIRSVTFTNFETGTADIDFIEGVVIAQDGAYSLELQVDTIIAGGMQSDRGELIITLYVEDINGGEVGSYITQSHDIEAPTNPGIRFPDLITTPIQEFSRGDHIYFVYAFASTLPAGSTARTEALMTVRVNNNPGVDERLVVRKHLQSGGTGNGGQATQGPPGESFVDIWTRSVSQPNAPRINDLAVDENGRFTSLLSDGVQWHAIPPTSGSGINYKQYLGIRGTTIRIIGIPQPDQGRDGLSEVSVWTRTTSPPGVPTALVFNQDTTLRDSTALGLTWHRDPAAPRGNDPLYRVTVDLDTSSDPPVETWLGSAIRDGVGDDGAAGANGTSYQNFYLASTQSTVSIQNVDYNGTIFSNFAPWSMTVPSTPQGANIFLMPTRFTMGLDGSESEEGIILIGTVPSSTTPPPSETNYPNGIEYGIANGNTPSATHLDSPAFSLSVGASYTTMSLSWNTIPTTQANNDLYIRLPAGLVLTRAVDSFEGEETSAWVRVGSTQVWTSVVGFEGAAPGWSFTVRRDN